MLLIDREPLAAGETSACGTFLAVLERLDALDALEQVHPEIAINAAGRRVVLRPAYPFATFDYHTLCEILATRLGDVEVAVGRFDGLDADGSLRFGSRRVRGRVLIDASGWRAVLARAHGAPPLDPHRRSVGTELRHGHGGCDLEFWARPEECPDGVFWAFPAGGHVREGVASYTGRGGGLRSSLAHFVHQQEFAARTVHGGVFPSRLRDPVAGSVFVVGDAAGQCLPLTGEGIRPALVWGQEAGRQAALVVRGEISLEGGLAAYRAQVLAHRWQYRALERLQGALLRSPGSCCPSQWGCSPTAPSRPSRSGTTGVSPTLTDWRSPRECTANSGWRPASARPARLPARRSRRTARRHTRTPTTRGPAAATRTAGPAKVRRWPQPHPAARHQQDRRGDRNVQRVGAPVLWAGLAPLRPEGPTCRDPVRSMPGAHRS